MKQIIFYSTILLLIVVQFLFLQTLPPGMKHDEMEYLFSSKTYALFGEDLAGTSFPLSLITTETLGHISAVPPLVLSPLWNFIPLTQETARIPYVILTVLIAGLTGYLSFIFFKNKYLSYLTIIFFLMNPWGYFLSHFAVDPSFALFFYLVGIILLLRTNGVYLFFALFAFLLGFFSYNAAKVLFFPVIIACLIYRFVSHHGKQKSVRQEVIFFSMALLVMLSFSLSNKLIPGSIVSDRLSEVVFFNESLLTSNVDIQRKQLIFSPVTTLFVNKATEATRLFLQNYTMALSPMNLFVTGDSMPGLAFYYHGLFYLIDALFIFLGLFFLLRKDKKTFGFLLAMIFIAPLATAVSTVGTAIVTRSFLLLPFLIILSAYGAFTLFQLINTKKHRYLLLSIAAVVFLGFFLNFLHFYFFRLPVIGQENFVTSQRVLAKYLSFTMEASAPVVVIAQQPRQLYLETLFYSKQEKQNMFLVNDRANFLSKNYVIDSVKFTTDCPKKIDTQTTYIVQSSIKGCLDRQPISYVIPQRADSGQVFKIIQGKVCKGMAFPHYLSDHQLSDFAIEHMTEAEFCSRWLIK